MNNKFNMSRVGRNARIAAQEISEITDELITKTLILYSSRIRENKDNIVKANQEDIQLALHNNASKAFIDRLTLNEDRIKSLQNVMLDIANQKSPVDQMFFVIQQPSA